MEIVRTELGGMTPMIAQVVLTTQNDNPAKYVHSVIGTPAAPFIRLGWGNQSC